MASANNADSQGSYTSITEADWLSILPDVNPPVDDEPQSSTTSQVCTTQLESSSALSSEDIIDYMATSVHREMVQDLCTIDPNTARRVLQRYNAEAVPNGWCREVRLQESKEGGYVQVSWAGANKFACLQTVVVWANGQEVKTGEDASHLCHNKKCLNPQHIIPEPTKLNQHRKGCIVWVKCNHCEKKLFVCPHGPTCIKYCEGYRDHDEFMAEGICQNVYGQPPAGVLDYRNIIIL